MSGHRRLGASPPMPHAATGPRTAAGKMRSRSNANRHGLAVPISPDPEVSAMIEKVMREIAGPSASDAVMKLARLAAEAQLDVIRCRQSRCRIVEDEQTEESHVRQEILLKPRAARRLNKKWINEISRWVKKDLDFGPPRLHHLANEIIDRHRRRVVSRRRRTVVEELIAIDRYEQRALARRNRALRELDCQRLIEAVTIA